MQAPAVYFRKAEISAVSNDVSGQHDYVGDVIEAMDTKAIPLDEELGSGGQIHC